MSLISSVIHVVKTITSLFGLQYLGGTHVLVSYYFSNNLATQNNTSLLAQSYVHLVRLTMTGSLLRVSSSWNQDATLSKSSNFSPKLSLVTHIIQFFAAMGLRSPVPCWLSARGLQLLQHRNRYLKSSPLLRISLPSSSATSLRKFSAFKRSCDLSIKIISLF